MILNSSAFFRSSRFFIFAAGFLLLLLALIELLVPLLVLLLIHICLPSTCWWWFGIWRWQQVVVFCPSSAFTNGISSSIFTSSLLFHVYCFADFLLFLSPLPSSELFVPPDSRYIQICSPTSLIFFTNLVPNFLDHGFLLVVSLHLDLLRWPISIFSLEYKSSWYLLHSDLCAPSPIAILFCCWNGLSPWFLFLVFTICFP